MLLVRRLLLWRFKNIISMCFLLKRLLRVFGSRRCCGGAALGLFLPGFLRILRVDTRLCAFWLPTKYPAEPRLQKPRSEGGARQTACWELPRLPCAGVDLCRGTGSPHTYFWLPFVWRRNFCERVQYKRWMLGELTLGSQLGLGCLCTYTWGFHFVFSCRRSWFGTFFCTE